MGAHQHKNPNSAAKFERISISGTNRSSFSLLSECGVEFGAIHHYDHRWALHSRYPRPESRNQTKAHLNQFPGPSLPLLSLSLCLPPSLPPSFNSRPPFQVQNLWYLNIADQAWYASKMDACSLPGSLLMSTGALWNDPQRSGPRSCPGLQSRSSHAGRPLKALMATLSGPSQIWLGPRTAC